MKNFFKKPLNGAALVAIALLIGAGIVYAAVSYSAAGGGATTEVTTDWGDCRKITNNNPLAFFVPAKTVPEWDDFLNNAQNKTIAPCSPACAPDYGESCTSSPNSCGQTNPGTYDCSGTCSASVPADPSYYGQSCTSSPNSCGQTNNGTYDCGANCSASTPDNSGCPIYGCTDSDAFNYNSGANTNDGSCHYHGCYDVYVGQYDMSYYGGEALTVCQEGVYGPDDYSNNTVHCTSVSSCNNFSSDDRSHTGQCDSWATGNYVGVVESVGSPYSCNW